MGTVVESSTDFFSSRLTKKERKATLADELLSDPTLGQYRCASKDSIIFLSKAGCFILNVHLIDSHV